MFRKLINEVLITAEMQPVSPISIQSGQGNSFDPLAPDSEVIKMWKDDDWVPIIPGSSIKGALRTRAEQLLSALGYEIDDPFLRSESNRVRDGDIYEQNCPVSRLFGSLSLKSRIQISDFIPEESSEIRLGVRQGVRINRVTGGADGGGLFDKEVVETGNFVGFIHLQNFELGQLSLVLHLLKEIDEGFIRLGSATSRGLGCLTVDHIHVLFRKYTIEETNSPLRGNFDDDVSEQNVDWNNSLIGMEFELEGFEGWIGTEGLLRNAKLRRRM